MNDVRLPAIEMPWWHPLFEGVADLVRAAAGRHAGSLLTRHVVDFLLDRLAESFPQVVGAARRH